MTNGFLLRICLYVDCRLEADEKMILKSTPRCGEVVSFPFPFHHVHLMWWG